MHLIPLVRRPCRSVEPAEGSVGGTDGDQHRMRLKSILTGLSRLPCQTGSAAVPSDQSDRETWNDPGDHLAPSYS